jgi:hypothetical protein
VILPAAIAAVLVLALSMDRGSDPSWHFTPDPGVRLRDAVSAEAMRQPDGSILLYVNTPREIAAFRSADGLSFVRAAGRMPLGGHPTVVSLPSGSVRMYYATAATLPYDPSRLLSAISRDGLHWFLEDGIRLRDIGFGVMEVVQLPDDSWRLYFNNRRDDGSSEIVSARSTRGITFHLEPGIRLRGPYVDPAVVRLGPGRWLMAVSTIQRGRRQRIFLAESTDGLAWRVEPQPVVAEAGANGLDPTLLPLGQGRIRLYYTRSRGRLFELRSGVLSLR